MIGKERSRLCSVEAKLLVTLVAKLDIFRKTAGTISRIIRRQLMELGMEVVTVVLQAWHRQLLQKEVVKDREFEIERSRDQEIEIKGSRDREIQRSRLDRS